MCLSIPRRRGDDIPAAPSVAFHHSWTTALFVWSHFPHCLVSKMAVLTFVNKTCSWLVKWRYWPANLSTTHFSTCSDRITAFRADWQQHIRIAAHDRSGLQIKRSFFCSNLNPPWWLLHCSNLPRLHKLTRIWPVAGANFHPWSQIIIRNFQEYTWTFFNITVLGFQEQIKKFINLITPQTPLGSMENRMYMKVQKHTCI